MRIDRLFLLLAALFGSLPVLAADPVPDSSSPCALRSNFDHLRDLAFSAAVTLEPGKSVPLNQLKRVVRADVVDLQPTTYDPASGRIDCSGTLRLVLPEGSRAWFEGKADLRAPIRFSAEPASDGQGFSMVARGLAPVAQTIAAAARRFPETPVFAPTRARPVGLSPPASEAEKLDPPRPPLAAGFDCTRAATATEEMICGSEALAETDRLMARQYFAVRARLAAPARQQLLGSQRRFLRQREQCNGEACLVGLYMNRKAQLDQFLARPKKR